MAKSTRGFMLTLSAESIAEKILQDLGLPTDAKLFKIVPSQDRSYCFDFLFFSDRGFETIEGDSFARIVGKEDLPEPKPEPEPEGGEAPPEDLPR